MNNSTENKNQQSSEEPKYYFVGFITFGFICFVIIILIMRKLKIKIMPDCVNVKMSHFRIGNNNNDEEMGPEEPIYENLVNWRHLRVTDGDVPSTLSEATSSYNYRDNPNYGIIPVGDNYGGDDMSYNAYEHVYLSIDDSPDVNANSRTNNSSGQRRASSNGGGGGGGGDDGEQLYGVMKSEHANYLSCISPLSERSFQMGSLPSTRSINTPTNSHTTNQDQEDDIYDSLIFPVYNRLVALPKVASESNLEKSSANSKVDIKNGHKRVKSLVMIAIDNVCLQRQDDRKWWKKEWKSINP